MARYSFDIHTDSKSAEAILTRLESGVSIQGMAAFLGTVVGPYLQRRASSRFAREGDDAVGGKWEPLRQSTVAIRESMGYGGSHPINRRTGELERYITQGRGDVVLSSEFAQLDFPSSRIPSGELGKKLEYAQTGRAAGNIPSVPRPVLGLSEADFLFVQAELVFFMMGARP